MTKDVAPYYSDGQITIYEVQAPVSLPVRKATDGERSALGKAEPYPRAPFVLASDLRIEIRFTLSNLDDHDQNVELLIDPWNEFVRYRPGVTVVSDEETIPNFSGFDKFFVLPAKSRIQGTITPDDTMELAVDLATAENLLAHPPDAPSVPLGEMVNHIFNLQNRSNQNDVLITPYIPKVIAGLTGFDVGIRSYAAGNVALEAVVDVTDLNGDRVLPSGSSDKPIGPPGTVLSPPTTAGMAP